MQIGIFLQCSADCGDELMFCLADVEGGEVDTPLRLGYLGLWLVSILL